ncbi:MAG: spheroidene monooxygenase [Actinobacteria bacterium]|nr:spheroidene monooxygenase [Actinomycetota bacterium]
MVTVIYFWRIPSRRFLFALWRMARDPRIIRAFPGIHFAKVLGCGKGETFTPLDADLHRWGVLFTIDGASLENFDKSKIVRGWRERSTHEFRILLDPISSHGQWSKQEPFKSSPRPSQDSQVVAITRARIAWKQNIKFWKAVPTVTKSLHNSPGLIAAIGIGEAPIGLQGTFSLWESADALRDFAYKGAAHREAIEATARNNWYSEELFARFAVRDVRGSL